MKLRLDGSPRRFVFAEKLRVYAVHFREIRDVAQEHGALDDVAQRRARGLENPLDIRERQARLKFNVAFAFGSQNARL